MRERERAGGRGDVATVMDARLGMEVKTAQRPERDDLRKDVSDIYACSDR